MSSVEKNDVDISRLFYWGSGFDITGKNGEKLFKAYIRLVGDAELSRARVFALRCSAKMRNDLKNKDNDFRMAFIPESYEDYTTDNMVELIASINMQEITRQAISVVSIPVPVEPDSDASLEVQEAYQQEIDDYPMKRAEILKTYISKELDSFKKELKKKPRKELEKMYENSLINSYCENEMLGKFKEMCCYFGCFKDKDFKKPLFKSYEEYSNILSEIKEQLLDNYSSLELSNDDLKK
jgi:hypothetical protein